LEEYKGGGISSTKAISGEARANMLYSKDQEMLEQ